MRFSSNIGNLGLFKKAQNNTPEDMTPDSPNVVGPEVSEYAGEETEDVEQLMSKLQIKLNEYMVQIDEARENKDWTRGLTLIEEAKKIKQQIHLLAISKGLMPPNQETVEGFA